VLSHSAAAHVAAGELVPTAMKITPKQPTQGGAAERLDERMLGMRPGALWQAFRAQHPAFWFICMYLFWEYLKPEQNYPIFRILPFMRIALIGAMLGAFLDPLSRTPRSPFTWLLPLFLLHCVVSAVFAYNPAYSYQKMDVVVLWVIIFFLITTVVTTEKRLFLFVLVYFLANFKMSQFGFFSWVHRGFGFASYGLTGAGWFTNSGELGLEMAMYFAYSICFVFFLRRYWNVWAKILMYFVPLSAVSCVIASSSRGAILGILGILVYFSFFSKRRVAAWVGTAIVVGLGYYLMPPQFLARFQSAGHDPTSMTRLEYWQLCRELMHSHPFLGIGYYNWIPYYRDHFFDPNLYWRVEEAHNTYLQMGAELGYVGLAIFLIMVLVSLVMNWKTMRIIRDVPGTEFLHAFAFGMSSGGIGLIIASTFLTAFFMPNYWIYFAFTVCLRNVARKRALAVPVKEAPVRRRPVNPAYGA
jgi:putative inorganic carbon (hco3(-)) transporter